VADNTFGIPVALHDVCLNCGCSTAFVDRGPAPTYRRLSCDGCECSRGRVSKELRTFLEKFVEQFGRPYRPIILRTGKVHKPGSVGDDAAIATGPKPKPKRKSDEND
jgi:hypothetical protein